METSNPWLTIHLYRKDEALASIRWAILSRNHTEAIFWGLELYDSNMEDDLIKMLGVTWVSCIGTGSFALLESLTTAKNLDRDQWCQLLYAFCKVKLHDSTAFYLMLRGDSEPADWQPVFTYSHTYETLEDALEGSLRRNKLVDAWLIARCVDTKTQQAILRKLATEKGRQDVVMKLLQNPLLVESSGLRRAAAAAAAAAAPAAAAFTFLCLDEASWVASLSPLASTTLPSEVEEAIQEWDAENSMRKRRVFKVRSEAIVYLCERSSQPVEESNEGEIQENLEASLLASPYWKSVIKSKSYMKTDRKREEFYDTFFTQSMHDIPDEWSLADREKSHGRGLGKSKELAFKHYINATFQRSMPIGIWNCYNSLGHQTIPYCEGPANQCVIHLPLNRSVKQFEITPV